MDEVNKRMIVCAQSESIESGWSGALVAYSASFLLACHMGRER
jgi:hypothetical protein